MIPDLLSVRGSLGGPSTRCGALFAMQLLPELHKQTAKHVFAQAISAISPIIVIRSMFYEFGGAGGEQEAPQFIVLCEFGFQGLTHDADLH